MKVEHDNTRVTLTGSDMGQLFGEEKISRDGITVELSSGAIDRMGLELIEQFGEEI